MSESAPRRAWQRMLSGRRLDLIDPSPLDVEISDIAHGLARVARWNGQTKGPEIFSVAQHSLLVEALFAARGCFLVPRGAAGGAAARCARICDRRHDLAIQGGGWRRLQAGRGAPQAGGPHPLRLARRTRRMISSAASRSPIAPPPISRRPRLPASRLRRRASCSASPTCRSATSPPISSRCGRRRRSAVSRPFRRTRRRGGHNSIRARPQGTASCLAFMSVRSL